MTCLGKVCLGNVSLGKNCFATISATLVWIAILLVFIVLVLLFAPPVGAEDPATTTRDQSAYCSFENGKQVTVRYNAIPVGRTETPPLGKVWMPGGSAMALFTECPLTVAGTEIPPGAYTIYLLPGKKDWKFIVSKNADLNRPYDEKHDLVRAAMETGQMSKVEPELRVSFGHSGPKQCEMNVDFSKTKAWIVLIEK